MIALAESEPYVRWLLIGVAFMILSLVVALLLGRILGDGAEREASDLHDPTPMITERRDRYRVVGEQIDEARGNPFATGGEEL